MGLGEARGGGQNEGKNIEEKFVGLVLGPHPYRKCAYNTTRTVSCNFLKQLIYKIRVHACARICIAACDTLPMYV